MRLATEFVKLPLRFDAERLAAEILAVPEERWRPHPQGHAGNSALPLLAAHGDPADDETRGPMLPTPDLAQLPYVRQLLAALRSPIGRTRLMRLEGNAEATAHADVNYYWSERLRVHVAVVTTPGVRFLCGEREVHMQAAECWVFDTWRIHNVLNPDPTRRIHLVADTVGSPELWDLIEQGEHPFATPARPGAPPRFVPWREGMEVELPTERHNQPVVMSPWEQALLLERLLAEAAAISGQAPAVDELATALLPFRWRWRELWALHGDGPQGWEAYRHTLAGLDALLAPWEDRLRLANRLDLAGALRHALVRPALNPRLAEGRKQTTAAPSAPGGSNAERVGVAAAAPARRAARERTTASAPPAAAMDPPRRFDRPIFIVSSPRAGSSLLFETLARSPGVWTVGGESHALIEAIPALAPAQRRWESNRLVAADATPGVVERLTDAFFLRLQDRQGRRPAAGAEGLRLLEKTPKNALRVPFLATAFPDALFVYLYRNPRETVGSTLDAWSSGRFVTYPDLPGWQSPPWSLLLVPGWRELAGRPLPEIAARQWSTTTELLLADLEALPPERWCIANYGALVSDPQREVERLCRFLDLPWDQELATPLPLSRHTLTPPQRGKWRRHAALLAPVFPLTADAAARALELFARRPGHTPLPEPDDDDGEAGAASAVEAAPAATIAAAAPAPLPDGRIAAPPPRAAAHGSAAALRSVATSSFAELLQRLRSSLVVSTYQSGQVVLLRADGGQLNTHFRPFESPMGIAVGPSAGPPATLALGTAREVWELRNVAAAGRRLEPGGKHDACFLPRARHVTGDVRVHELAYAGDELWLVNTRFSCLCTLDSAHSFVPRWRPPFVTALAPEDRCHLNGLAVVDGHVRYVTALGRSDTPQGWREQKASGGLLLDVPSGETVATGLCMPHSPRWHDGRLWVLESGKGQMATVEPASGRLTTVAQLPGFTRGLAFAGPFAFVGLSQVRESVFGGVPLARRLRERACGVWVIDTRSGATAAFMRFEDAVQEIFDVAILPGLRFPEVAPDTDLVATSWVLPEEALAEVPAPLRS
ncbi:MAG TPA: TIGR03032 family protein [Thermoanaerobaculia bacterium]|jgi:uncharacterized protein (TIGR03032 family)|nr:TIGR03032 family protein [Thermoanaerobaculia bacterium]